jgi:sporulation delaying protein A
MRIEYRSPRVFVLVAIVSITLYMLHGLSRPPSPVRLPLESVHFPAEGRVWLFIPQGWQMFTRDPRLPYITASKWSGTQWLPASYPDSDPRNLFGLRRTPMSDDKEISLLTKSISDESWRPCAAAPISCLSDMSALPMHNASELARVCGEVGLIKRRTVPLEFMKDGIAAPAQVLRLTVTC